MAILESAENYFRVTRIWNCPSGHPNTYGATYLGHRLGPKGSLNRVYGCNNCNAEHVTPEKSKGFSVVD